MQKVGIGMAFLKVLLLYRSCGHDQFSWTVLAGSLIFGKLLFLLAMVNMLISSLFIELPMA